MQLLLTHVIRFEYAHDMIKFCEVTFVVIVLLGNVLHKMLNAWDYSISPTVPDVFCLACFHVDNNDTWMSYEKHINL